MNELKLTRKDFIPNVEVKWCPGCVDYSVLAQVQKLLPELGVPKENHVFVSGIGCSSRFPYYMDTFGVHSIHGRAPAIATGIKVANPELTVWVVTGDGDALAIGGNHVLHALRRNVGIKILLLNNRIYGLTKGQYSPTSELGKKTKSTPEGSVDYPVDPVRYALGCGATFVARAMGNDPAMLQDVLLRAAKHEGTAFVEILQNCVIFNDGAFDYLSDAASRDERRLQIEHGKPLRFGKDKAKGIVLGKDGKAHAVNVADVAEETLLVHDEKSDVVANVLARLDAETMPTAFGVFRAIEQRPYEALAADQIATAQAKRPMGLQQLLESGETWTVAAGGA